MQFTDLATVAGTRRREDGSLLADARIARTGIQTYLGSEVGKPDMAQVRVYRPGSEVFSDATLKSAAHRPVTNDHPAELVTADNWKQVAVGQTSDEITGEGIYIRVPLMVSDGATIADIENGKRELSAGYTCDLDFTAGKTPGGDAYDAIQKNIRINHVAIVAAGRAGSKVRIGDAAISWGASPVTEAPTKELIMADAIQTKTVIVDGLSVITTDQGEQAIVKLLKQIADAAAAAAKTDATHADAIKAKDAELAKKDAEIDTLKGKIVDGAALDKLVASRAALVTVAKAIAKDVKTDGLSDAAIRRAAVTAVLGDAAVKDKADAYIDARFEILAEDRAKSTGTDPVRDAIAAGLAVADDKTVNDAYAQMVKDLQSGTTKAAA